MHIREKINAHFGTPQSPKEADVEHDVIILKDDDHSIEEAIAEARESIDDVVVLDERDEPSVITSFPTDMFVKIKKGYDEA